MVVVADSSPLRYLIVLGKQDLLPELLGEIWIPSAVLEELSASAAPAGVRAFLHSPPGWLKLRDPEKETWKESPSSLIAVSEPRLRWRGNLARTWCFWTTRPPAHRRGRSDFA